MRTNISIHHDKQNNKKTTDYRVRIADNKIPKMRKCITKYFKTKKEAETYELEIHRVLQFIYGEK